MTQENRLRPRLGASPIFRCQCGGVGVVKHSTDWRSKIDREMGQVTRGRRCSSCGKTWHTVELEKSELQRLRRLAHAQVMSTAR